MEKARMDSAGPGGGSARADKEPNGLWTPSGNAKEAVIYKVSHSPSSTGYTQRCPAGKEEGNHSSGSSGGSGEGEVLGGCFGGLVTATTYLSVEKYFLAAARRSVDFSLSTSAA